MLYVSERSVRGQGEVSERPIFTTVIEAIWKNPNFDMVHQIKLKFFVCFILTILLQRHEMSKS
jgi:hypothetical protein